MVETSRDEILARGVMDLDVLAQRFGLWDQQFDANGKRRPSSNGASA